MCWLEFSPLSLLLSGLSLSSHHLHSPLTCYTSVIIQLYVLTFHMCLLSIMLLFTGTSGFSLCSHNLLCIYLCGAGLFPSLLSTCFSKHSCHSDLEFLFDLCTGSCKRTPWSTLYKLLIHFRVLKMSSIETSRLLF